MLLQKEIQAGNKKKLSLTTLLTGLVTLVVVLTSTLILVASYESKKQSLIETTLHLNFASADNMSQTADSLFRSMRSSLQYSAARLSDMNTMKSKETNEYLELMRNSSNYFNSIVLVNENAMILNVAPQSLAKAGGQITSKAARDALRLKMPLISEPYKSSITGRLIVFMSQPLFNSNGHYRGFIGGSIYLQENNILNMIYGNNSEDDTGSYFYIVDSNGHLIFHPDKKRIGEDVSANKIVKKLLNGKSGQEQVINSKGIPMLAGYSSVAANGWGVVMVSPTSTMNDQLTGYLRTILWFTLIPFVILLLGVILIARRLARPFVFLADLVQKIGKENIVLPDKRSHWNREADLLTQAVFAALKEVQKQTDQLTQEAMTDALTGLTNRRQLELSMNRWVESKSSFSLIVMDVDKFKFVNDTYGHLAGDEVLKQVAEIIRTSVRPGDLCFRYGGEEFVILLNRTKAQDAFIVAERIRGTLQKTDFPTAMTVTVSQGIAHYPTHADTPENLLGKADEALYEAKSTGRNRTVIAKS